VTLCQHGVGCWKLTLQPVTALDVSFDRSSLPRKTRSVHPRRRPIEKKTAVCIDPEK